jgi:hypothetical protein
MWHAAASMSYPFCWLHPVSFHLDSWEMFKYPRILYLLHDITVYILETGHAPVFTRKLEFADSFPHLVFKAVNRFQMFQAWYGFVDSKIQSRYIVEIGNMLSSIKGSTYSILRGTDFRPSRWLIFSLLSLFWKKYSRLMTSCCVCVFVSPQLTFERLNQSLWNLVRISRHLIPFQRPN